MKKVLIICAVLIFIIPASFLAYRHKKNQISKIPYPFIFKDTASNVSNIDAPILIMGDTLAQRIATHKKDLATKISGNIAKKIKIQSIATADEGLHRTLEKLKSLKRLPLIILLITNHDNNKEVLFHNKDIKTIQENLKLYSDPLIQSFLMVFPDLSRYLYKPVDYVALDQEIAINDPIASNKDHVYQIRMKMYYQLYEAMLNNFINYARKRNSIVIPITTPLNFKLKPNKSCYGSMLPITEDDYNNSIKYYKKKDYKGAYNYSKNLVLINSNHAASLYLHAIISEKLNKYKEAKKFYELAIAYDCQNTQASPVFNAILKQVSHKNSIGYFDYHQYLYDLSHRNYIFQEKYFPQDIFIEKLNDLLAIRIKSLLKL